MADAKEKAYWDHGAVPEGRFRKVQIFCEWVAPPKEGFELKRA
jgi:hypothetical protein